MEWTRYRNVNCLQCDVGEEDVKWCMVTCYEHAGEGNHTIHNLESCVAQEEKEDSAAKKGRLTSSNSKAFENWYRSVTSNTYNFGIPPSISVLINFGLDNKMLMYSAVNAIHGCTDDQLWDPFSLVCRDVYCATGFDLVNFQCIEDSGSSSSNSSATGTMEPVVLPSADVVITLTGLVFGHLDDSPGQVGVGIEQLFPVGFADYVLIIKERYGHMDI